MDSGSANGPEENIEIAERALEEGDLRRATAHVASALGVDPNRSEWRHLLDRILTAAPQPLELAPIDGDKPSYCLVAVHAYILARLRRVPEAVDLLVQVLPLRPDVLYVNWVIDWVQRPEAVGKLNLDRLSWLLGQLVENFPALMAPDGGGRATLERMPRLIRAVRRSQPPQARFLTASVSLLRRLDYHDEAMELANEAYALEPGYHTAVALAVAHETRRDVDKVLAAYRDALHYQPEDIAVRLSMADLLWDQGKPAEARPLYEEVLQREPEQPWALASVYFLRWMLDEDGSWRDKLLTLHDEQPDNDRARFLAGLASPYVGYLPEPTDTLTNLVRHQFAVKPPPPLPRQLTLSCLEAPSNFLAYPPLRDVELTIAHLQEPDPRRPRRRVEYLLWRYDEVRPIIAVPPPQSGVQHAVAEIARSPYRLDTWQRHAARLAGQLRPEFIEELLATMVYPPLHPQEERPWAMVFRIQVVAALVLAQLDGDWEGSARRQALLALVHGPMDWTVDAALIALAVLARDDEGIAADVGRLFRRLRKELPDAPVCYRQALLHLTLLLPNLSAEERADVRGVLQRWQLQQKAEELCYQAEELAQKEQWQQAIERLTEALQLRPTHLDALQLRGRVYLECNEPDKARADFSQVLQAEPYEVDALLGRAAAHLTLKQMEAALADYSAVLRLDPEQTEAYYHRGRAHAMLANWDQALADLNQAIARDGKAAGFYLHRGLIRTDRKEFDHAITDFTRALDIDPELAAAYRFRAMVHADSGRFDLAIRDSTEEIRLCPDEPQAFNVRARGYYELNNFAAALADHEEALRLAPEDARTANHLAWIWATCSVEELRNGPRALEYATKACELTSYQEAFCLDTLAAAYAACGRFTEAVEWARKAMDRVEPAAQADYQSRLELYQKGQMYRGK